MKYKYVIIDPASTEFNRGSFCYLPYIVYNYLLWESGESDEEYPVEIMENFTVADIDNLPEAEIYLVALWSYPQIDACLILNKFLNGEVWFFGYEPLIDELGLRKMRMTEYLVKTGIKTYPHYYNKFKYLLLSDCDMHLAKYENNQNVVPLFTSYGCPRNCAFCPATVNVKHRRYKLSSDDVLHMLTECLRKGFTDIHFTDEDFFFDIDRTHRILLFAAMSNENLMANFRFICLGEVRNVLKYIEKYGNETLIKSGMKLIEVGLETADEDLGEAMGKHPIEMCKELSDKCKIDIFWLTLTFFPGETISTLNKTGDFIREHGFKYEEVTGRIRTNGTEGGLGQFFQPYHGTKDFDTLKNRGNFLSDRPVRLLPSYVPYSFTFSSIKVVRPIEEEDKKWFRLYKLDENIFFEPYWLKEMNGKTVGEAIDLWETKQMRIDVLIFIAICARLRIIEEMKDE